MRNNFQWTDELVNEFICYNYLHKGISVNYLLNEFKQLKQSAENKDWEIILSAWEWYDKEHESRIKSVRRLSDNEVFSIGDCISYENDEYTLKIAKIKANGNDLYFINATEELSAVIWNAKKIKQKQPLFTTEDNVPIYEFRNYWGVDCNFECYEISDPMYYRWESEKYFSTQQAAKEYVLMNKKQFSVSEINETIRNGLNSTSIINLAGWLTHYFYETAKTKTQ